MSEYLIKSVLREYAEDGMPMKDPWPAIESMVEASHAARRAESPRRTSFEERLRSPHSYTSRSTPAVLRTRWAGANAAVFLVAMLALTSLVIALLAWTRTPASLSTDVYKAFVPAGKVRHVVISYTTSLTDLDASGKRVPLHDTTAKELENVGHSQDLWYTDGVTHPLLYLVDTFVYNGAKLPSTSKEYTWVDENTIYRDTVNSTKTIERSAYRPGYFELLGPDPDMISKKLRLPGGHVIGNSVLNGRAVIEIETASTGYPPDPLTAADVPPEYYSAATPEPPSTGEERTVTRWRLWIDTNTLQPLRWQHSINYISGPRSGQIETQESNVVLDKMENLSDYSPDQFKFKLQPGYQLHDYEFPTRTAPAPTPTAERR